MKKILVVFTGGTIGSTTHAGIIDTTTEAGFTLIKRFEQLPSAELVQFDCIQPYQLLSENLHPTAWTQLIQAIEQCSVADYDGIIVTHGTDTLAFTAAALSLYFYRLQKPLLLVSSNYPLDHPNANGLQNFVCAVAFICQQIQHGVFVPYTNPQQITQIHLGTRLASSLQLSGDFISVQSKSYLKFQQGKFDYIDKPMLPLAETEQSDLSLKPVFSKRILLIKPYPGLDYSRFDLTNVDAVLHDLYHSGTACTLEAWGKQHSLIGFVQRCQAANIVCYLAPALKTKDVYASYCALAAQGITVVWNMSLETAYVKLLLAYGNFNVPEKIAAFLAQDLALEHFENND